MSIYPFETVRELKEKLIKKMVSPREVYRFYAQRYTEIDHKIGASLEFFDEESVFQSSVSQSSLYGIPGLLKDNICQKGRITSCASRILENYKAVYDATVSHRLKQAGLLLAGRANMDEFAMGSSTETSAFKKTANPWDITRVPGGSSGGSAAAVAAGIVPWALGSETGGSVRHPAALCGIVGLKPTYGLVSRFGLIAYGSSLDQIGLFSRTAYDAAMIFSTIAGHDERDGTSIHVEPKDYTQGIENGIPSGLRIGVVDYEKNGHGMDPEVVAANEEAIRTLESLGATITKISLPALEYSAAVYFIISRAEAASNLARFDGVRYGLRNKEAHQLQEMYHLTRRDGFGPEVQARILVGNYVLSAGHSGEFYDNALKVREQIRQEFIDAFKNVDLLVMPTHPVPAFPFGQFDQDKLTMDLQDFFTCSANLAGIPAISLPCGFTKNRLPIGFQLIGPALSESLLFQVSHAFQQKTDWHMQYPSL